MQAVFARTARLAAGPIARGAVVSAVVRLAGVGLSFLQGVLTARLLGASGYGAVAFAMSVAQVGATLALFGMGPLAVREISARRATGDAAGERRFLRFAVPLVLLLSFLAASVVALAAMMRWGVSPALSLAVLPGAIAIPLVAIMLLMRGAAQGTGDVAGAQLPAEIIRPALTILLLFPLWLAGRRLQADGFMAFALTGMAAAAAAGSFVAWRGRARAGHTPHLPGERRAWLADGGQFLLVWLTAMLQGEINTLLLASLAGPHEAGIFQPVARLAPLLTLAVEAAAMRYTPRISALWQAGDIGRIATLTGTFTVATTLITLAAALPFGVTGPLLMQVFGPEFAEAAPLLWIVGAAQVFNAACGPVGAILTMSGHAHLALASHLAALAITLALCLWLVPGLGATGAALAMAAGIAVANLGMAITVRWRLGFDPSILAFLAGRR